MEYIGIGIIIAAIAVGIILYAKSKKSAILSKATGETDVLVKQGSLSKTHQTKELIILPELVPAEEIPDENKLVEITDSNILSHVNNLVPGLAQAANTINNVVQAAKANGDVMYRAIIPAGAKLADSKSMEGAFRGIYHGVNGIEGHANLVEVDAQKGTAVLANAAAAAMAVASMVVGQYYMTQINAKLGVINDGISQVKEFQDNEYRSKVFSLVAHIKSIADFQTEILGNDELRLSKITQLDSLEEECTQLLGQANITLAGFANKTNLDYEGYEKALRYAQDWFTYQQSLIEVLYRISELRYTLYLGAVSREQCTTLSLTFSKQVSDTQASLIVWHEKNAKRLGIDEKVSRRKRDGFDRAIHFIPGMINNKLKYREIDKRTANMITTQKAGRSKTHIMDESELYSKDVQLISKDGKIYYLPESKAE